MGDLVSYDEPVLEAICQGRAGVPVFSSFQTLSVWYPSALSTDLVTKPLPNRRLKCQTTSTFNNSEFGYKTNCLDDVRSKSDTFSE